MRLGILLLATLALLACGGDDKTGTAQSSPAATTTLSSTAAPDTRTATPAGTAGASSTATPATSTAAAARTATPTATAAATAAASATAPAVQSGPNVTPALLAQEDLPAGWVLVPSTPDSDEDAQICNVRPADDKPLSRGKVDFTHNQLNVITHSVAAFTAGQAEAAFTRVTGALSRCNEWTNPDNGLLYRVTPTTAPRLGDQAYAYRLSTSQGNLSIVAEVIYIRRGDFISSLGQIVVGQGNVTVDGALTEQLARRADEKLAALTR